MTTMFVQLRRVVYLLVLLQCCTSVAYAESVKESAKDVVLRRGDSLKKIEGEMEAIRTEALENISDLKNKLKVWKEDSERAKSVADEVRHLRQVIEAAMRNSGVPSANKGVVGVSITAGLLENAIHAVEKAEVAVKKAKNAASIAKELGNSCLDAFYELNSLIWAHKSSLAAYLSAIAEAKKQNFDMTEESKFAEESRKKQEAAYDAKNDVIRASKQCFESEGVTNSQAVSAEDKMRELESLIHRVKALFQIQSSPTTSKVPGDDSNNVEENQTPEEVTKEPVVTTEGPNITEGTHTAGNGDGAVTAAPNTAPPKDVTRPRDSSSSPALVHSPLLLLLVSMCVLGCTAVF